MKGVIFFLLAISISLKGQQSVLKQWDKVYGGSNADLISFVSQTYDGGVVLGGGSYSDISGDKTWSNWDTTLLTVDYWIVKTDSNGIKLWDKRYGGMLEDILSYVKQTSDNGYILGGSSPSNSGGDKTEGSRGGFDYWLVKLDSLGNKQWDKRFGGGGDDQLWTVEQTIDGGYLVGGHSTSGMDGDKSQPGRGGEDYWVVKIDSVGNKKWDRRFGGSSDDFLYDLKESKGGEFLLAGLSRSGNNGDKTQVNWANTYNYWVVKIDSNGNKIWDKRYGTVVGELFGVLCNQTSDNGFIVGGSSYSGIGGDKTQANKGNSDYWIIKIDSLGNQQWDRDFGGSGEEVLRSLSLTQDGGYLLGGNSKSSMSGDKTENNLGLRQPWVVKIDSLGNKQWDKTSLANGTVYISNSIQTQDGCYVVGTFTGAGIGGDKTQPALGSDDYWMVKYCLEPIGINEILQQTLLTIYPNPFTNYISISLLQENISEATFTISNLIGQVIYNKKETNFATGYTKMLDLSWLPGGVYFVEVTTPQPPKGGVVHAVKKLVKE